MIDDRPYSLPIPTTMPTPVRFADLAGGIGDLVETLTKGRISAETPCHLDPDIDAAVLPRAPGWRGALGQISAAQGHLRNQGIGKGDLFLFWGLFQPVVKTNGQWRYTGSKEHRIFGWLQVQDVINVGSDPRTLLDSYPWLERHPHARIGWNESNTVYVSAERLRICGRDTGIAGWGVFRRGLRLTASCAACVSDWHAPRWLNPTQGGTGMTYHADRRWQVDDHVRVAARGQEFVANVRERQDATDWLISLFAESL